jgi:hypothetical protein
MPAQEKNTAKAARIAAADALRAIFADREAARKTKPKKKRLNSGRRRQIEKR